MKKSLLGQPLHVINMGLKSFHDNLLLEKVDSLHVQWRPSLSVSEESRSLIEKNREKIDAANQEVLSRLQLGSAVLTGMGKAIDLIPGMTKKTLLHAGPPVTWERMCGPMKGAMMGALIYEKMAQDSADAERILSSGEITFSPCHEHNTVGPMAGVVSPSMPVFVVENERYNVKAYTTMNEGLGKVLRYGAYSAEVIDRLRWMENVLYPNLEKAILNKGKIDLRSMIAMALHMGDEVHNRNRAATSLFYRTIAPALVETVSDKEALVSVLNFINGNDHFFLNLSMASCKAILDAAFIVENSSVVTVMARNGTDFGIRLSGTAGQWFTGTAPIPDALFFPGYSAADANPDIGDSAITETAGLGGMSMAASPAIVQFVGGSASESLSQTKQMYEITVGESSIYQIPSLDFRGSPTAIDVRLVIEKNITPLINTGVAHKEAGVGQVGAGILSAPALPFQKAYEALAKNLK